MTGIAAIIGAIAPTPLISATASPNTLTKSASTSIIVTSTTVVTVVGGVLPLSHSWTQLSGDTITITAPTSASTTLSANLLNSGDMATGIFKDTVTDASGAHIDSNTVSVTISRT